MSRDNKATEETQGVTRRGFLKGASFAAAAVGTGSLLPPPQTASSQNEEEVLILGTEETKIALTINGENISTEASPSTTLLDLIRGPLDLTGSKRVCDRGSCGACTVLVDGKPICSCSYLALDAQGKNIQTVEGLMVGDKLSPLQNSFVSCDALQCGFCTPGMLMSCTALLEKNPNPNREEIAKGISGNLCRCGTYQNIFEAVHKAATGGGK